VLHLEYNFVWCWNSAPEAHTASYTMGTEFFLGVKLPRRGVDHPPLSRAEVK
jgi:hypothetical protein